MPKYVFECQVCATRFDRVLKMGDYPTYACPSCKEEAPRLFAGSGFGFGFAAPVNGSLANTGVHSQDYPTADQIVGNSAEKRWETYIKRESVKKVVRQKGASPALARLDGDGFTEYAAMVPAERQARGKLVDYAVAIEKQEPAQ